jgi:TRAP-type C4-dicarboxylate transport system substrate-binding protein
MIEQSPYKIILNGMLGGISRQLYNSQRPIQTLTDLKGLKLRVQHSPVESKIWSALGTVPQQLAWSEIYTSLQTGVVQGAESSIDSYYQNKFFEVAPYFAFTNHQFMVLPLIMSKKTFDKLPPDLRSLVLGIASESCNYCLNLYLESEKETQKLLAAKGVKFSYPDIPAFQAKVADIVKTEAVRYKGEDILDAIKKLGQ